MPYSREHKKATRQKILNSAIRLFSSKGFDQVSIDSLMLDAGLTRGAFYSHFKSKQDVYAKAIIAGAKKSGISQQKPIEMSQEEWAKNLLLGYLSEDHVKQNISPCPLAFLVTDIANNEVEVKDTYTRMFKLLNKTIKAQLKENTTLIGIKEQNVLATTAMMIGGVAISRALNDDVFTKKFLESCRQEALVLIEAR